LAERNVDQVFVAMSFDPKFKDRFDTIIKPAIEDELIAGRKLTAYRVDNSKTGDSILTDIASNIAHSRLILADVSVVDEGRYTEKPIRNGNVMFPSEVLLVRDDTKPFLFDVSSIPHVTIDFGKREAAIASLRTNLTDRIRETDLLVDARVQIAARQLIQDEIRILRALSKLPPDQAREIAIVVGNNAILSTPTARGRGDRHTTPRRRP
jgi:hypothetical protein